MSNATCTDTDGSFYCNCTEGFEGNGTFCFGKITQKLSIIIYCQYNVAVDVNECDAPVCDTNANCSNTYGSYFCTCVGGYTGNGSQCEGDMVCWSVGSLFHIDLFSLQTLTSAL